MTWKEKSVSYDGSKEKVFRSMLGDIKVSWRGIERNNFQGEEKWERILDVYSKKDVFYGFIGWEEVKDIVISDEDLSFPHVDLVLHEEGDYDLNETKIVFFRNTDSEKTDNVREFYNEARKRRNAYLQKRKKKSDEYSFQGQEKTEEKPKDQNEEEPSNDDSKLLEDRPGKDAESFIDQIVDSEGEKDLLGS